MRGFINIVGICFLLGFGVLAVPGCFDTEPRGVNSWTDLGEVGPNVGWVFFGLFDRFNDFSEKQQGIQGDGVGCAGAADINCDGVVDSSDR